MACGKWTIFNQEGVEVFRDDLDNGGIGTNAIGEGRHTLYVDYNECIGDCLIEVFINGRVCKRTKSIKEVGKSGKVCVGFLVKAGDDVKVIISPI